MRGREPAELWRAGGKQELMHWQDRAGYSPFHQEVALPRHSVVAFHQLQLGCGQGVVSDLKT